MDLQVLFMFTKVHNKENSSFILLEEDFVESIHFQELWKIVIKEVAHDLEAHIFGQILSAKKMELKAFYP